MTIDGEDVNELRNVYSLRRRIGMVFPLPVGLPMSIYDNVAYGPCMAGIYDKDRLDELVERCLKQSVLWDEVKDRLKSLGTKLSGGQQQRLTLARALSLEPEILCLDEFSIAIDPVTTMKIEDVLTSLKSEMTIILVTNLIQQAQRISDNMMFLNNSEIVEQGPTPELFANPKNELTARYLGRNGLVTMSDSAASIRTRDVDLFYGDFQAFSKYRSTSSRELSHRLSASGCGKTTLLRSFNRINERYGNHHEWGDLHHGEEYL